MKNLVIKSLLLVLFTALSTIAPAQQAGELDRSFNYGMGSNYQFNYWPNSSDLIRIQSDGKIIIAGNLKNPNEYNQVTMYRLNSNGSLDTSFVKTACNKGIINDLVIQKDGKIIIGGAFNDKYYSSVFRLNQNGSLDTCFNFKCQDGENVTALALLPNRKIVIGIASNHGKNNFVKCLNINGSIDKDFKAFDNKFGVISKIVVQNDCKIIFSSRSNSYRYKGVNYSLRPRTINRLNVNGTVDASFENGGYSSHQVNSFFLQTDGKIIVNIERDRSRHTKSDLYRLNNSGTYDESFKLEKSNNEEFSIVGLDRNGKIIVNRTSLVLAKDFNYNDTNFTEPKSQTDIIKLNSNGTIHSCFENLFASRTQLDGKIIVVNETEGSRVISRITENGNKDFSFNLPHFWFNGKIKEARLQSDGKIIISRTSESNFDDFVIIRLNLDGSYDSTFKQSSYKKVYAYTLILQPDGKIIVYGSFYDLENVFHNIIRLNKDGSYDKSFSSKVIIDNTYFITKLALKSDGRIIAAFYNKYGENPKIVLTSIKIDGSLDSSFIQSNWKAESISNIVVNQVGKIILFGYFKSNKSDSANVVRLDKDGRVESRFNHKNYIYFNYAALLPNGKIVCIESDWFCDTVKIFPTLLNADGSLDISLVNKTAINKNITAFEVTQDGKMLIGGFTWNDDQTGISFFLQCLDSDFFIRNKFSKKYYFNNQINDIILQSGDKVIVVGNFYSYNNLSTPGICRIHLDGH